MSELQALPNDPNPSPTPAASWVILREYIRAAWSAFGSPLDIARTYWLHRKDARAIRDWLFPLEQMLRRLIFIEIIAEPVQVAPIKPARASRKREPKDEARPDSFNLDDSETWRVSFNLNLRRIGPRQRTHKAKREKLLYDPGITGTAPLAIRLEALLRGFNDPERLKARMRRAFARDRGRLYRCLSHPRKSDQHKPAFAQLADVTQLAADAFNAMIARICLPPPLASGAG